MTNWYDNPLSEIGWVVPDCPYCGETMECVRILLETDSADFPFSAEADFICMRKKKDLIELHGPSIQTITF